MLDRRRSWLPSSSGDGEYACEVPRGETPTAITTAGVSPMAVLLKRQVLRFAVRRS